MAVESVYANALMEQEVTSPQALLMRCVEFREKLRKCEQAVGYAITGTARGWRVLPA